MNAINSPTIQNRRICDIPEITPFSSRLVGFYSPEVLFLAFDRLGITVKSFF
jgi:hypothetical protein